MAENLHCELAKLKEAANQLATRKDTINQIANRMEEIIAKANGAWEGGIAFDMLGNLGKKSKLTALVSQQTGSYSISIEESGENYKGTENHTTNLTENVSKDYS